MGYQHHKNGLGSNYTRLISNEFSQYEQMNVIMVSKCSRVPTESVKGMMHCSKTMEKITSHNLAKRDLYINSLLVSI
jgi:hypothetical protein